MKSTSNPVTGRSTLPRLSFPLWHVDQDAYRAVCAHLGITPIEHLHDRLSEYLASAPFRFPRPKGFSRFLAKGPLTRSRIAHLDVLTKWFFPEHPLRHILNGVIALHECDPEGYAEMAVTPTGWSLWVHALGWGFGFALRVMVALPWLCWQLLLYAVVMPFRPKADLEAKRVLITGVHRGLGLDLLLHCLEQGAEVVGTVRNQESVRELRSRLPACAPIMLLIADLSRPNALVDALCEARITPESLRMVILSAGVKHDGESVQSLASLRDTMQVNFLSAAEFATWLCRPLTQDAIPEPVSGPSIVPPPAHGSSRTALVLVSSMGRWHGMHFACGYNASKAALSIWGESLDMELRQSGRERITVTIAEPGIFESDMVRRTPLTRILFVSRQNVAARILRGALAGERSIRTPIWFALLTWGLCMTGREFRYRLFARAKPKANRR